MGTSFWEVVCDEHCIGGDREQCGDNDAQIYRASAFNHEA
jgi:hypothetical protein